jgi:hypothetical protein
MSEHEDEVNLTEIILKYIQFYDILSFSLKI